MKNDCTKVGYRKQIARQLLRHEIFAMAV